MTVTTTAYPIRYVAFDNPGIWVENENKQNFGGSEWSVYHEPAKNLEHPHIEDGIYIGISSFRGIAYILDCQLTLPVNGRKQHNQTIICNTFEEAKCLALEWLPQAQYKMKSRGSLALPHNGR